MNGPKSTPRLHTEYLGSDASIEGGRLLIVLHGLGDSMDGYRFLPQVLGIPGLSYLLVNAPDPYYTGYSWYDIMGDQKPGVIRSRELLVRLLDDLIAQGWNAENIGLFGFSQGCVMSLDLALRYPRKFGCVVGVSGYVALMEEYPKELSAIAREQKILVTHGSLDTLVPSKAAKVQLDKLRSMGVSIEWKEYRKEHTIDPNEEIPLIQSFIAKALSLDLPQ